MNGSALNPEIVRSARIQLRPGRIIVVIAVCGVISITAVAYYLSGPLGHSPNAEDGQNLLNLILSLQIVALLIGGGIYCLQSVHREKDLNTFDYQRITRLTPLELLLGKLFGAPIQMYFSFLCLMPVAIWAAVNGRVPASNIVRIYVLILLGSITYHSLALVLSLVMERGTTAGAIIIFLAVVGLTSIDFSQGSSPIGVHSLSPFYVYRLFGTAFTGVERGGVATSLNGLQDSFFGMQISHVSVLLVLYMTLTAWFLLAGVRNIKRDPLAYELYSPPQGFAFLLYLYVLLLGFIRWSIPQFHFSRLEGSYVTYEPLEAGVAEPMFLAIGLLFMACFGLTLLRNRDRVRRRIRELGQKAAGWWAAVWPAPYVFAGSALAGLAIVRMIQMKLHPLDDWSIGSGLLGAAFFSVWVVRDILYLQWMNLRRVRRPLLMAVLYMVVFYTCVSIVFVSLKWYDATGAPYASIFVPVHGFQVIPSDLADHKSAWNLALLLLCLECLGFAWLQWRALQDLLKSAPET
jgi:hypothetical protein